MKKVRSIYFFIVPLFIAIAIPGGIIIYLKEKDPETIARRAKELFPDNLYIKFPRRLCEGQFSYDGRFAVLNGGDQLWICDLHDKDNIEKIEIPSFVSWGMALSPDSNSVFWFTSRKYSEVLNIHSKERIQKFPLFFPRYGHNKPGFRNTSFSLDGQKIATKKPNGQNCVLDVKTGRTIGAFGYGFGQKESVSIVFTPNNEHVVTVHKMGDIQFRIYDSTQLNALYKQRNKSGIKKPGDVSLVRTLNYPGPAWAAAFSPDGKYFICAGEGGIIQFWDTDTYTQSHSLIYPDLARSLCFSNDSKLLAAGGKEGLIRIWNLETGEMATQEYPKRIILALGFSSDNRYLYSFDSLHICRWEIDWSR